MSYVVVVTKPSVAQIILPLVKRMHPGRRVLGVLDGTVSLLTFAYPRGMSMADYPHVSEPRWRPNSGGFAIRHAVYEMVGGQRTSIAADPFAIVREAEAVICAEGDWYGNAANFDMLLRHSGGDALAERPHAVIPWLRPRQIGRPVEEQGIGSTHDDSFVHFRDGGLAKRRFDWCFAINSQAILGEACRRATGRREGPQIGKYGLQTLYALRCMEDQTEGGLAGAMHRWKGTGRYAPKEGGWGLGSAISAAQIVEDLKNAGLVDAGAETARSGRSIGISETGRRLLDLLHPDCEDPDLPFRIRRWQKQGTDSHATIDRYIRTFFGKQKRFMARSHTW
jgi:hypothetical protein